jgi:hypothetical protein
VRYEIVNKLFNVVALKIIKKEVADILELLKMVLGIVGF